MIPTLLRFLSLLLTAGRLRSDLALENLALGQQLAVLRRQRRRPGFGKWIGLARRLHAAVG